MTGAEKAIVGACCVAGFWVGVIVLVVVERALVNQRVVRR